MFVIFAPLLGKVAWQGLAKRRAALGNARPSLGNVLPSDGAKNQKTTIPLNVFTKVGPVWFRNLAINLLDLAEVSLDPANILQNLARFLQDPTNWPLWQKR